ncbi:unnamed protein product, partial [Tenebrio molitor]
MKTQSLVSINILIGFGDPMFNVIPSITFRLVFLTDKRILLHYIMMILPKL